MQWVQVGLIGLLFVAQARLFVPNFVPFKQGVILSYRNIICDDIARATNRVRQEVRTYQALPQRREQPYACH